MKEKATLQREHIDRAREPNESAASPQGEVLTISATKVKTILTCEQQYYYEYIEKRPKSEDRVEALRKGEDFHSRVFNPIREGGWQWAVDQARGDALVSSVYRLLPKEDNVRVEERIIMRRNGLKMIAIPDILYAHSVYDLKTTSLPSSMSSPKVDDIIQLHFYYRIIQDVDPRPNLSLYIIKVLLPEQNGEVHREVNGQNGKARQRDVGRNGHNGHAINNGHQATLFKINLIDAYFSRISRAETRILEMHGGSKPRPNPGRACFWCGFNDICPFSPYRGKAGQQ